MRLGNRDIYDECSKCENFLCCELNFDGHGIKRERTRVTEMLECQFRHSEKTKDKQEK